MNAVQNDTTSDARFATPGYGVLICNEDTTCVAYVRTTDEAHSRVSGKGMWSATGVIANGPGFQLNAKPVAQPASGKVGPRMRGELVFTATGEVVKVVVWLNPDGTYGINGAGELPDRKRVSPF